MGIIERNNSRLNDNLNRRRDMSTYESENKCEEH